MSSSVGPPGVAAPIKYYGGLTATLNHRSGSSNTASSAICSRAHACARTCVHESGGHRTHPAHLSGVGHIASASPPSSGVRPCARSAVPTPWALLPPLGAQRPRKEAHPASLAPTPHPRRSAPHPPHSPRPPQGRGEVHTKKNPRKGLKYSISAYLCTRTIKHIIPCL